MENPAPESAIPKGKWQALKVPPGSIKTVACVKRSGKMNRFCKVGTLNSGGPVPLPSGNRRDVGSQHQGDTDAGIRESDPPIVVRDGNAGHKAKERAGKQRKHRYLHGIRILPAMVSNSLLAMGTGSGTLCQRWFRVRAFLRSPVR